jgi:hypothetical protein
MHAHDTGLSHSNRTLGITADAAGYELEYRLQVPPDVALLELAGMDVNRDGEIDDAERDTWFAARAAALLAGLNLSWDSDKHVPPTVVAWRLDSGLTQTYRFRLPLAPGALRLDDRNFLSQPGHLRVRPGPGLRIETPGVEALNHVDRISIVITRQSESAAKEPQ